jgi:hypothetical protein
MGQDTRPNVWREGIIKKEARGWQFLFALPQKKRRKNGEYGFFNGYKLKLFWLNIKRGVCCGSKCRKQGVILADYLPHGYLSYCLGDYRFKANPDVSLITGNRVKLWNVFLLHDCDESEYFSYWVLMLNGQNWSRDDHDTSIQLNFIGSTWPRLPCRPLFLSGGMPIPSDLSDFPLVNSCGNGTYVFEISRMCVSRLENCNISGVECGKIRVFEETSRISIAFSDDFLDYSKNVFNVKVCCPPDQNLSNK